jgi:hypothetical protein
MAKMVKELYDSVGEYSEIGEQMFMLKSKVFDQWSVVIDDLVDDKTFVIYITSKIQNISMKFHKFYRLFSMKLSQLGLAITSFTQMVMNVHKVLNIASALPFF